MTFDAGTARTWLAFAAAQLQEAKDQLTALDAAIGDADHGINITRGFGAVRAKLQSTHHTDSSAPTKISPLDGTAQNRDDIGAIFKEAGMTLMSQVGGASGMLYGNFFLRAGAATTGKAALDEGELLRMLESGRDGIVQRGRAAVGDKTMLDVWAPALDALAAQLNAGEELDTALDTCVAAAEQGLNNTIALQAKKGRASYLGERSIGHADPGAASSVILLVALRDAVRQAGSGRAI